MNKTELLKQIVGRLENDYKMLLMAAKSSHAAATHEDNIPDSKYETLALEASYIAQGQANRAQEIKMARQAYRTLSLQAFNPETPIRLTALVLLEDEAGKQRWVFLGPSAGGMKLMFEETEVMVITPDSPLGEQLIGLKADDAFELVSAAHSKEYEIIQVY